MKARCIWLTMIKYTSCYDRVFTCLHNSYFAKIVTFFSSPRGDELGKFYWTNCWLLCDACNSIFSPCAGLKYSTSLHPAWNPEHFQHNSLGIKGSYLKFRWKQLFGKSVCECWNTSHGMHNAQKFKWFSWNHKRTYPEITVFLTSSYMLLWFLT